MIPCMFSICLVRLSSRLFEIVTLHNSHVRVWPGIPNCTASDGCHTWTCLFMSPCCAALAGQDGQTTGWIWLRACFLILSVQFSPSVSLRTHVTKEGNLYFWRGDCLHSGWTQNHPSPFTPFAYWSIGGIPHSSKRALPGWFVDVWSWVPESEVSITGCSGLRD